MPAGEPETASLRRLTKRSEFVKAGRGNRAGRPSFALQAGPAEAMVPGIGFTVSKKVGNAPERNRVKRRLRAAVSACASQFRARHDYVLVGRREALGVPFQDLVEDLGKLIDRVHTAKPNRHHADGLRNPRP